MPHLEPDFEGIRARRDVFPQGAQDLRLIEAEIVRVVANQHQMVRGEGRVVVKQNRIEDMELGGKPHQPRFVGRVEIVADPREAIALGEELRGGPIVFGAAQEVPPRLGIVVMVVA